MTVALVGVLLLVPHPGAGGPSQAVPAQAPAGVERPNVVLFLTDDQTLESLRVMNEVQRLLVDQGTSFTAAAAAMPLCCPSRATLLTGQYPHNHGVRDNLLPDGGYLRLDDRQTLPVWLHDVGYRTAHVGRTLNQYTVDAQPAVPDGWDEWYGLVEDQSLSFLYSDFVLNGNGRLQQYGDGAYLTDVLGDLAVQLVDRLSGDEPFYLEYAPAAPHTGRDSPGGDSGRAVAASRHAGAFDDTELPVSPAVFEADISDKPDWLRAILATAPPEADRRAYATEVYRDQLRSLLAVDEAVAAIVDAVEEAGELDATVFLFTSDNGFLNGEHGLLDAKVVPYEPAVHMPLVVRGPGFPAGARVDSAVTNADVVPTVLRLAGAEAGRVVDGVDLQQAVGATPAARDRVVLVEGPTGRGGVPGFEQAWSSRWTLTRYDDGSLELYDRRSDPGEVDNLGADAAAAPVRAQLLGALDALRDCDGEACLVTVEGLDR